MDEALRTAADFKDSEQAAIEAAVRGDVGAFASLYDRHLERVYRYVYYSVTNKADAEDLSQQVFLQAWRAIKRYQQNGGSFVAWLLTIAHNLVMSFYRRSKEVPIEIDFPSNQSWTDPEAMVLAKYDRLAVQRAIMRLKPEQQQVVVMRFVEHLEYGDIAASLGKSEGNIRVIQHRALGELRRLLAHEVKA